jgi:hypothetical protein
VHPYFTSEIARYEILELHRQAEIDRLIGRPRETKAPTGRSSRRGWLWRLVKRPAAA